MSTRYFVSRIEDERARANRLLLNVLPVAIAERLKSGEAVIADRYEHVTVLFTDIVGFAPRAAGLEAREVVLLLDEIFSAFDAIADDLGLEEGIKTIGDAYMLVCGAPEPRADHAESVADAALRIRDYLLELSRGRQLELSMRIGIRKWERWSRGSSASGSTVRPVGQHGRHGEPRGSAWCSRPYSRERSDAGATRRARYVLEERGVVTVKGKGDMKTFWLEGTVERERAAR